MNELTKLPLWKSAADELLENGLEYGTVVEAEWLESRLKLPRNDMYYSLGVSNIRNYLINHGFYLCGRGQRGRSFTIRPSNENADQMQSYSKAAVIALKRGVVLGTNTRLDALTDSERRRHEAILERMALKAVLLSRSCQIVKAIKKHAPHILEKPPGEESDQASAA